MAIAKAAPTEFCIRRNCKCDGCRSKLSKVVTIPGVDSIDFHDDVDDGITATVVCTVDPEAVVQKLNLAVEWWVKTSQQVPSESTKKEFEGWHDKHEHKLELKTYKKQFACNGCRQFGFGARYRCETCDYELHETCRSPKPTTSHDIFGGLTFDFSDQPTPGQFCNACGDDINGYHYHCRAKDFDLHPCCSKLQPKLCISGMEFYINEKTSSKCRWCKQKKRNGSNIRGWSYVSSTDKYQFYVYCIAEMAHNEWKKSGAGDADQDVLEALEGMNWEVVAKSKRNGGKAGHDKMGKTIMLLLKTVACVLLGDLRGLLPITITGLELVSKYT